MLSILDRHDLVKKRRKRNQFKATSTYLSNPEKPNDLWSADFKGQFQMQNQNYCFPLTLSDQVSRFLLTCEAMERTELTPCFSVFERACEEYGLPEAIHPARENLFQQQETFDQFRNQFNGERPHEALHMKRPADVYQRCGRIYRRTLDITYSGYDKVLMLSHCGRLCIKKDKIHLSRAFANQPVGLKEIDQGIWQVDFMDYNLGYKGLPVRTFKYSK